MTVRQVTLDTGALIAIERRKQRGLLLLDLARHRLARLLVPVPVIAEWWRGRTDARERILEAVSVLPLSVAQARAAGEALGKLRNRANVQAVDAIVMAFAAANGGVVYTGDVQDLERIRTAYFPSVRVLGIGDDV
ncbi:MAG: PIN domain-containing protein [Polyangiaceae bacterium]|nr:PIN domain-containing protein [Polyangiaceae bacterium]MCK6576350.1 PIN domain-containing protein [Myxococcota bacterium]